MAARTKEVELTVRVRVPKGWSPKHARYEVSQGWHGVIYALGPPKRGELRDEAVLKPRFVGPARLVKGKS